MNSKGFSISELMICLVILVIVSALGYPSIVFVQKKNELRNTVFELISNLQRAKIEAVKTHSDVVIEIFEKRYQIFVDDGKNGGIAGDWLRQPNETMLFARSFSSGVTFSNNYSLSRTRFTGRVATRPGTIIIQDESGMKKFVIINAVGRIRAEDL